MKWVLEWSPKTNNFHIQKLIDLLAKNQAAFIDNKRLNDYHIIFIGEKEACHQMADNWRHKLNERQHLVVSHAV